jgi:hypothetical protein
VDEVTLTVGTFNEHTRAWEMMPEQSIVSFDAESNTITVTIPHASYWAVVDGTSFASVPTSVNDTSWGTMKQLMK